MVFSIKAIKRQLILMTFREHHIKNNSTYKLQQYVLKLMPNNGTISICIDHPTTTITKYLFNLITFDSNATTQQQRRLEIGYRLSFHQGFHQNVMQEHLHAH